MADLVSGSVRGAERLVDTVTTLSHARSLETVVDVVRRQARELVGADGAAFVLREGDLCHYVDEDAIGPLWKGRRFPMSACVSGWVMRQRTPAVIEDVFADARVPAEAYRPTFVKSVVMVPIRRDDPIGAIGTYWAHHRRATPEEVHLLQALADVTSVTLQNVDLYAELERRVAQRTLALQAANRRLEAMNQDLDAFAGAVAHDLRSPLATMVGLSSMLEAAVADQLDERSRRYLAGVRGASSRMGRAIDALLGLSRAGHGPVRASPVDLAEVAESVVASLRDAEPARTVNVRVNPTPRVEADPALVRVILENLVGNAWKYTRRRAVAHVEIGAYTDEDPPVFYVRDDGPGLSEADLARLFRPFQRGDAALGVEGHGIGLATVRRAVERHGGRVWAERAPGGGAELRFTLAEP